MQKLIGSVVLAVALSGCSTTPFVASWQAAPVTASAETVPVGTANADAADDPAIWHNAANPEASLIVATDKKAGLYVYGLDGQPRDFDPAGELNNVDLVTMPQHGVIVLASDRNDPLNAKMRVYKLNTDAQKLEYLGLVDAGSGEAYGLCLLRKGDDLIAYSALKDGTVAEFQIDLNGGVPVSKPLRTIKIPTQIEGCVADPRNGTLYVGEEEAGIWRIPAGASQGELVVKIDNLQLVADVEGLALVTEGTDGGWLVASSQGDNTYARFRLPDLTPAGRFRIAAGTFGSTEETDGIDLDAGNFGPTYPKGLFVAQDGMNGSEAQNFKLVSWQKIEEALKNWQPIPKQP